MSSGVYNFNNVLKVTKGNSRIYLQPDSEGYYQPADTVVYYFAPHVGLVKRENPSENEVWELESYSIQQ